MLAHAWLLESSIHNCFPSFSRSWDPAIKARSVLLSFCW